MSVRLFHKGARLVVPGRSRAGVRVWYAVHTGAVAWQDVFAPPLRLVGYVPERAAGGLRFGTGSIGWTRGALWTTIRLTLPPCSERKATLLAAGLLKAARYALVPGATDAA